MSKRNCKNSPAKKTLIVDPARGGNYEEGVCTLVAKNPIPSGTVQHINILHDDYCAIFDGGSCSCDPTIEVRASA